MNEKIKTPETVRGKNLFKSLVLSGGVLVLGAVSESAQAQEATQNVIRSHAELSIEEMEKLPYMPRLLDYADRFYTIETLPDADTLKIFKEIYDLDITGTKREGVIDQDGNSVVVNYFTQHSEGECKVELNDDNFPIVITSETPEICEMEVLYFPKIENLS